RHGVGDEIVDVELAVHVPVNDLRHIGAASGAAERRAFPHAARHQLEWPRLYFLAGASDADNDRNTPAAVAAFQRLAHKIDIADAFETVVGTTACQLNQMRDEIAAHLFGIDEMGHAEFAGER